MLDTKTILVLTALGSAMMSVGMFAVARTYPTYIKGITWWAWACVARAVGWVLLGAHGAIPDFFSIALANTLVVLSLAINYHALCAFTDEPPRDGVSVGVVGATGAGLVYFTSIAPNGMARTDVMLAGLAVLSLRCGQQLLGDPRTGYPLSYWLTGVGFLGGGAVFTARLFYEVVVGPRPFGLFAGYERQDMTFLVLYVTGVILNFGFLMMCTHRLTTELARLATLDPLTELSNRRNIEHIAAWEVQRAQRASLPFSVLLVDLDNFKAINDTYGHAAGDAVLQAFAGEARRQLRGQDIIGRYGGEEFLVVLPNTLRAAALGTAERLRHALEEVRVPHKGRLLSFTVSIGAAEYTASDLGWEKLIARADAALYAAKSQGRNQVCVGA
jgi:diguanylate cyclase (GGDEF)-like protein